MVVCVPRGRKGWKGLRKKEEKKKQEEKEEKEQSIRRNNSYTLVAVVVAVVVVGMSHKNAPSTQETKNKLKGCARGCSN